MRRHVNGVHEEEPVVDEDTVMDQDDTAKEIPIEATNAEVADTIVPEPKPFHTRALISCWDFFNKYDFPILLLAFIGVAKLAPEFGAVHLAPQYTATWIAVALIFCKDGNFCFESPLSYIALIQPLSL